MQIQNKGQFNNQISGHGGNNPRSHVSRPRYTPGSDPIFPKPRGPSWCSRDHIYLRERPYSDPGMPHLTWARLFTSAGSIYWRLAFAGTGTLRVQSPYKTKCYHNKLPSFRLRQISGHKIICHAAIELHGLWTRTVDRTAQIGFSYAILKFPIEMAIPGNLV